MSFNRLTEIGQLNELHQKDIDITSDGENENVVLAGVVVSYRASIDMHKYDSVLAN